MPVKTTRSPLSVGVAVRSASSETWREWFAFLQQKDLDFCVLPVIPNGEASGVSKEAAEEFEPVTGSALAFDSSVWRDSIALKISEPAPGPAVIYSLQCQLEWVQHCGAWAAIIPSFTHRQDISMAELAGVLLRGQAAITKSVFLLVEIPLFYLGEDGLFQSGWHWWTKLRMLLGPRCEVQLCLRLVHGNTPQGPRLQEAEVQRWLAEPVRLIIAPEDVFLTNEAGTPVLPKICRRLVEGFMDRGSRVCMEVEDNERGTAFASLTSDYFRFVWKTMPALPQNEQSCIDWRDYLQVPLQPLADNLESETYEVFEADPVKYRLYEEATKEVIAERMANGKPLKHLALVGGGRGPLMARLLSVLRSIKFDCSDLELTVVEKNLNAVKTLRYRTLNDSETLWRRVKIVHSDMRCWKPERKVDLVISELLGSFGDNELSPECLDGVEGVLAEDSQSIPQSYTSFLEPVMNPRCHRNALEIDPTMGTGFVVKQYSVFRFTKEAAQACFEFVHPNPELNRKAPTDNQHNSRYRHLDFTAVSDAVCHGFAGYFQCQLSKVSIGDRSRHVPQSVICSIEPRTASPDMVSWFPIYIPLKDPVMVKEGDKISVHVWRRVEGQVKVWYEWCLTSPVPTGIQNGRGQGHSIMMS